MLGVEVGHGGGRVSQTLFLPEVSQCSLGAPLCLGVRRHSTQQAGRHRQAGEAVPSPGIQARFPSAAASILQDLDGVQSRKLEGEGLHSPPAGRVLPVWAPLFLRGHPSSDSPAPGLGMARACWAWTQAPPPGVLIGGLGSVFSPGFGQRLLGCTSLCQNLGLISRTGLVFCLAAGLPGAGTGLKVSQNRTLTHPSQG